MLCHDEVANTPKPAKKPVVPATFTPCGQWKPAQLYMLTQLYHEEKKVTPPDASIATTAIIQKLRQAVGDGPSIKNWILKQEASDRKKRDSVVQATETGLMVKQKTKKKKSKTLG